MSTLLTTRLLRWFLALAALGALLVLFAGTSTAQEGGGPPLPEPLPTTGIPWQDNIYYGAIPADSESKPVLVFVHGLGRRAEDWWAIDNNDMYLRAYDAGYRTAFVTLDFPRGGGAHSTWRNGEVLSQQIAFIANHYDVDRVDIVAHSKGGIDSQAAIVHYGAWEHVRNVFTLATPHQGSELADFAYSPYGQFLVGLFGELDDGTCSITTAYMQQFRALTDGQPQNNEVHYYTGAGDNWNVPGTFLVYTGQYLFDNFGENDGFVTVSSTELEGAQRLFIEPYNHFTIRRGGNAFPWILAALENHSVFFPLVSNGSSTTLASAPAELERDLVAANAIFRGGRLADHQTETVTIEPGARGVQFHLLLSDRAVRATLRDPQGGIHTLQGMEGSGEGLFGAAYHLVYQSLEPMAGAWTLQLEGSPEAGYALLTTIDSPLHVALEGIPQRAVVEGEPFAVQAAATSPAGQVSVQDVETTLTPLGAGGTELCILVDGPPQLLGTNQTWTNATPGLYAMSVTVKGETAAGAPFERSFVRTFAVLEHTNLRESGR